MTAYLASTVFLFGAICYLALKNMRTCFEGETPVYRLTYLLILAGFLAFYFWGSWLLVALYFPHHG